MKPLEDKIKKIIEMVLGLTAGELDVDAMLGKPEQWDSFAQLNIIMALEQEFSLSISIDDAVDLTSIQTIHEFLKYKV